MRDEELVYQHDVAYVVTLQDGSQLNGVLSRYDGYFAVAHTTFAAWQVDALRAQRSASYNAAKTGEIPTLRIGHRLLVPTHKLRDMLGFHDERSSESNAPVAASTSVDPTLRHAVVAAAEAFLRVMRHANDSATLR